jgi:hypothetical protein
MTFWFGHLRLSLKFEEDLMSGCRYIQLLSLVNLSFVRQAGRQAGGRAGRRAGRQAGRQTDRHLSGCKSSLASAEIEILLRMEMQPRFVGSGKIWARLNEMILMLMSLIYLIS